MSDLPPLEQPQAYVVVGPNDQRGPYTLELLIGEVLAGRLYDSTPVWWPGLAEWTTMSGHPALAAEIARRRGGYADPQAFAPPAAPAPAPGQYEQAQSFYESGSPAQATQPVSGQDYSADMYAGESVAASPAVDPTPAQEPYAPVQPVAETPQSGDVQPAEAVGETQLHGDTLSAEVTGGTTADVPQVAGPAEHQRNAFADVVRRSSARAEAAARVDSADAALAAAFAAALESAGLSITDRNDGPDRHELRASGDEGETLTASLGRLSGADVETARGSSLPLEVRCTSTAYGGGLDSGTGAHGEVVIVADEWSGQATASVSLLLPASDYVDEQGQVDQAAVARDVDAVVAMVRHRLR